MGGSGCGCLAGWALGLLLLLLLRCHPLLPSPFPLSLLLRLPDAWVLLLGVLDVCEVVCECGGVVVATPTPCMQAARCS